MNVLTPAETPSGVVALTQREAEQRIEQLREHAQRLAADRALIESEIRQLMLVSNPETAYEAIP